MASSDDISEQLSLMTKLNNVVERMAKSVASIESSYETQISTLEKVSSAISSINVERSVTELNKINETLKDLVKGFKDVGQNSDQSLGKIAIESGKANTATTALSGALGAAVAGLVALATKGGKGMNGLGDSVEASATQMNKFDQATTKVSKGLTGKLVKATAIGAGAIHGFMQGLRNITAMSKGVLGFTTSFVSALGNIAASIIAIPLKIFTGLVDMAAAAEGGGNELLQALENLRKEMGNLNKSGSAAVLQTTKTMQGFSDTGLSTWRVFGTLAERLEFVTKLAVTMGATFGKLKGEFIENGGALLGFMKGLGATDEQMKALGDRAVTMGTTLSGLLLKVTKQTLALGDAFDIDQKLIGKDIARAIVDVKHFGSVTVKEIGQASVYARKLGLELDKIVGTLDAFETFDSAAENAAKLGQSFGVTIDAFQLMEAQSPAEQLDMLRKSFKDAGVDASQFSRQQLKLLSSTTGLDEATAKQAFSMKNQGVGLDQIKKKSEVAEKKTLTQAEAMSKLADSIERMVKSGPALTGSFFDMFVKGFLRGIQSSKEFRQMIMFIKRDLAIAMQAGVELGRTFEKVFPGVKDFFGGISEFFRPERFRKLFKEINVVFTDFFKSVAEGKFSFPELMSRLQKTFFSFFDTSSPSGQRVLKGFMNFTTSISKIIGQAIPWITEQLGKGLQTIADFIADPSAFGKKLKGPGQNSLGFIGQILEPIITGLKKAWANPIFQKGLHDFVEQMGIMLEKVFKSSVFQKIAKTVIGALLTSLFAPAIMHAALAGITTKIGGAVVKQIGASLFKKGGIALAEKAGGAGIGKLASAAGPVGAIIAAGAAIGKGVNTYTDQINSTMDHSSKVLGAGATGIIDGITLGLLPDDMMSNLANTFASLSDTIFGAMESVFGKGFTETLKRRMASTFEVFGNLYNFIAELFTGDQESFTQAAKDLGLSVLRMVVSALEITQIQLPLFLGRMAVKILTLAGTAIIKIISATLGIITGGIDDVFGTSLSKKLSSASDNMAKQLNSAGDSVNKAMLNVSEKVANTSSELQDKYLRTAADQAKIAKQAADKIGTSQAAATADANKKVERSLSQTLGDIKSAKEIKAELTGEGGVDLTKLITEVKAKLSGVNFKLLDEAQAADLAKTSAIIDSVKGTVDNITNFFSGFAKLPETIKGAVSALKKDAIKPAIEAVNNMIQLANQLDSALADGNLNKLDVRAKLSNVANSVGLGGKASYSITSKPVNITINMTVTMNAEDIEKALIMRGSSIIRDRLNFATGDNAGRKGSPPIPETPTTNLSKIQTAD